MDDELDYAEMLEIPMETVTVSKREKKKKKEEDLQQQLVDEVNERMDAREDPAYAESIPIERNGETRQTRLSRRILLGEFIAACALAVTIFFTNIFVTDSAVNTFVRGLFISETAEADNRVYSDFTLSSVVNDTVDTEIAVSSSGVLSFTAKCSVYTPCDGTIASVNGDVETGYTVEIKHSDKFSTVMSGLDIVYSAAGDDVTSRIPIGYSNGEGEVRVMFYEDGTLITAASVDGNTLSWS